MKATIVGEKGKYIKPKFPCIYRHRHTRAVVLFESLNSGMCLIGDLANKECRYYTNFMDCDDISFWEPLTDITINFKMD